MSILAVNNISEFSSSSRRTRKYFLMMYLPAKVFKCKAPGFFCRLLHFFFQILEALQNICKWLAEFHVENFKQILRICRTPSFANIAFSKSRN